MYQYDYPRPSLTVDAVVFGWEAKKLQVLLIKRKEPPYEDCWALPGGFVQDEEPLDAAAIRELREETGLENMYLEQLYTFGGPGRDPRGHVVTVAYYALVCLEKYRALRPDTDASDARWFPLYQTPPLAFDHSKIIKTGLERLRGKVRYRPVGFELLPEHFSIDQLQKLYEGILDTEFDRRNFRKKFLQMGLLVESEQQDVGKPHRNARFFKFDRAKYAELEREGFQFRI